MCDKMLGYMVRRVDVDVLCTVNKPSNEMFYVTSRTKMYHNSINSVFFCAASDSHLLGCVRNAYSILMFDFNKCRACVAQ